MAAKYTFARNSVAYLSDGTQVAANVPRFEAGKFGQAVMVEEGTMNKILYSEDFSVWSKNYCSIQSNVAVAPNGTMTADKFVENTTNNSHYLTRSFSVTNTSTNVALSLYVKPAERTKIQIYAISTGMLGATFDLSTLTATDFKSSAIITHKIITSVGNGWYRIQVSGSVTFANTNVNFVIRLLDNNGAATYTGDGVSGIYIWGVQVEEKPYCTSYMQTVSTQVTRSPETLTIPTAGVLNENEFDIAGWFIPTINSSIAPLYACIWTLKNVPLTGLYNDGSIIRFAWNNKEVINTGISLSANDQLFYSVSKSGSNVTIRLAKNGGAVSTFTGTTDGTTFGATEIVLGSDGVGESFYNGKHDDLRISNRARSDAEILAAYQSGQPLPVDEWTTRKIYFDELDNADLLVTTDGRLEPLNLTVIRDSRYDMLPSIKEFFDEIPGRHGEIVFGSKLGSRLLELHVASPDGLTPEQKESLKRDIAKYLNPTAGVKSLVFLDDPEKMYMVKYAGKIDITQYADSMEFTIPFKMANPYIIGSTEKSFSGSGIITNSGNAETPLKIEIAGDITNPTITLGSYVLSYTGTIPVGQTLVVDTEKMTVTLNGTNVLYNWSGGFPKLQPGNNLVSADSKVTFKWRDRWL